jgi:hypothetical protein
MKQNGFVRWVEINKNVQLLVAIDINGLTNRDIEDFANNTHIKLNHLAATETSFWKVAILLAQTSNGFENEDINAIEDFILFGKKLKYPI